MNDRLEGSKGAGRGAADHREGSDDGAAAESESVHSKVDEASSWTGEVKKEKTEDDEMHDYFQGMFP